MNQKTTKRALLASVMSLMLSLAMLIGATFAWFTDTASTAVNKIQSGTLKLSLQYAKEYNTDGTVKTWEDAEGGTLNFLRTDGTKLSADANILWEPGATYKLPQLKISNEGSLALKYKVVISGATGDTDLLSQIDFTSKVNGGAAATFTDGATLVDGKQLLPKEGSTVHSDTIDIEGTMKTTADNKYQNKTITGIAITVAATQATYENDSISDQYDKDAEYPIIAAANVTVDADKKTVGEKAFFSAEKVEGTNDPVAKVTVSEGTQMKDNATQLKVTINKSATPANFNVKATEDAKTLEVKAEGLAENNTKPLKVELYVGSGLSNLNLYHRNVLMKAKSSVEAVTDDQDYYYNKSTGVITMLSSTFSPFTYTFQKGSWNDHVADKYITDVDKSGKTVTVSTAEELALFAKQVTADKVNYSGYTVNITKNIDLGAYLWKPINASTRMSGITINGNNHTVSNLLVQSCTNSKGYGTGFIGDMSGSITIKDVSFTKANVTFGFNAYWGNVGGIVMGYTYGTTLFENVSVTDSTIWGYGKVGCLLGMGADPGVHVTFKNCVSKNNTIHGVYNLGGLAGNIQRKEGTDNGKVENCTVENVNVIYDNGEKYVDLNHASATFKNNDRNSGIDVIKTVSGKWWIYQGYYWGGFADYYVSYGYSEYDAPVSGYTMKLANSEYCVNK